MWRVRVFYFGELDEEFDRLLNSTAGRVSKKKNSGYCFENKLRDVSWDYDEESLAELAAAQFQKYDELNRIKKITITFNGEERVLIDKA